MSEEKPRLVITTVGTSLIEKLSKEYIKVKGLHVKNELYDHDFSRQMESLQKECADMVTSEAESKFTVENDEVQSALVKLKELNLGLDALFAPAEIASLWRLNLNEGQDKIILLNSDTPEGVFCARVIAHYFRKFIEMDNDMDKGVLKVEGLQVENAVDFKNCGLKALKGTVNSIIEKYGGKREIIFNITGGFKAVIPYLTILAWESNKDLVYIFEESESLIKIKRPKEISVSYDDLINNTEIVTERPTGPIG